MTNINGGQLYLDEDEFDRGFCIYQMYWSSEVKRRRLIVITLVVMLTVVGTLLPAAPARALSTEIVKPTTHTISGGGTITNPASAYDSTTGGEDTSYNRMCVSDNNDDPTIEYHAWLTPS